MEQETHPRTRRSNRSNVLLTATIEYGGASLPVKLRNLSETGALIEAERLPGADAEIVFRRNDLKVHGRIAWVSDNQAGIAFATTLLTSEVLRNIPQPRQRAQSVFRRPALRPRALSAPEQIAMDQWLALMVSHRA
jgi:hypothetical protein